jgi:DHA1 family multidrug resistance protein-like MFS transporter
MPSSWQRNLWAVWFAEFTAIIGFAIVLPILPFYVQELGISDPDAITFWSGLIFSVQAVTMALMAPVWGMLSDRHGRKLMIERAMFGGAVIIGLMGLVQNVQQLTVLRALQGALTGTVTAATTMVASTAPRERSGYALGILQMGIYTGASVGPLLGGIIADTTSLRAAFWATSGLLLVGGLLIALLVKEEFNPVAGSSMRGWPALRRSFGPILASRPLVSAFGIRLIMRSATRLMGALLPLFVQQLLPWSGRAATISGLVQGTNAGAGALGAILLGRVSDRVGRRQVLVTCGLVSAALYAAQFFVTNVTQLALLQGASGLAMGGILAALSATLAALAPEGRQGAVYGVDATVVSLANAVAPMIGTSLAMAAGLRAPLLCAAGLYLTASLVTTRLLPRGSRQEQAM